MRDRRPNGFWAKTILDALEALRGEASKTEIVNWIAENLVLNERELTASGHRGAFNYVNSVGSKLTFMVQVGRLNRAGSGRYRLPGNGRAGGNGAQVVSPEEFVDAFHPLVVEQQEKIRDRFDDQTAYTYLLLKGRDAILARTGRSLGLTVRRKVLKIDAVFAGTLEGVDLFKVAIEHGHDADAVKRDMTKLAYLSMPLKVLITYPVKRNEHQLLRDYERIIQITQVMNEMSQHRRHLAIFAFKDGERIVWRYHVYTTAGFKSMTPPGAPASVHA